ncbi:hemagglutinin repeat-containing protein (plasmid) [Aquicoccus sp. G2-2]|uniref:hemagglutinin repeat-containing protein n=1 Tax=Aquicoccus sp. G2-2 TaxID=3092120 RepID=UPI002ADFFCA4|nr:hemagglutinin repeat-containing protein [Aquicoccus sp. G2-2]MEA1111986.1 hemagglutinin repeat-containing protein [Aquicoccus sp. G2-2]
MVGLSGRVSKKVGRAFHGFVTLVSSASIIFSSVTASYSQQIIVDPSAPGTSFLQTGNGTPQVNIATPQSGVSLNQFTEFNVDQNGLVLNNSTTGGVSVIGQNVTANPNLMVSGPAGTIVNEVTSAAPSTLTGTTEVFGQSAAVVIANPNGISCNGCAFLNSTSSTLTTGKPIINGSRVDLLVTQGTVSIGPGGFAAGDQAGVFGRHLIVDGAITTDGQAVENSLVVSGGAQRVQDLSFGQLSGTGIVAAPSTVAKTSPFAIDASERGTLTGGTVVVRNPEAGQGVNLYGVARGQSLSAQSAGDLFYKDIESADDVTLTGSDVRQYGDLTASGDVNIGATSFTLYDGRLIEASGDIDLGASEFVVIAGEVSGDDVTIDVTSGSLTNTGFLMADGELTILADDTFSQQREIAREYDIYFDPALQQYLQAYYQQLIAGGPEADIAAEMIARASQHEIIAEYIDRGATATGTNVNITATDGDVTNTGGAIAATNDVRLQAGADIINTYLALRSRLDAEDGCPTEDCGYRTDFHAGEILAGNDLDLVALRDIRNEASDIAAANNVTLDAGRDVVNALKKSSFETTENVAITLTSPVATTYCGKSCSTSYSTGEYTTIDVHINEENILSPARIAALYGDVSIVAGRDFVSQGSQINAGVDLDITTTGQAILTSYVDAEEHFIHRSRRSLENVCTTGKDGYCSNQIVTRTITEDGTVLVTATSEFAGRSINITSGENITILGARILASEDLDLTSTGGSILIDSTDLPDTIALDRSNPAEFVELTDDLVAQIFGPATGENAETVAENTADYIAFLQDSDLLTAVEALRRAESGADIKGAARDVGVQGYVSLIDSTVLQGLREDAGDALTAIHNSIGAQIDAHNAALADYNAAVRADLAEITDLLEGTEADRSAAMQGELDQVTAIYDASVASAEQTYQSALAANEAQYGHLLTKQELRSRQVGYGKGAYTEYYYVTVPNTYYVNLKNTADQNAANDRTAAVNVSTTQRQLSSAQVQASYSDAALSAQIADLNTDFQSTLATRASEKATLYANLNTALTDAVRKIELVIEQEAQEEGLRSQAIARGTVQDGEASLAQALTSQEFGELDRIGSISVTGTGLVQNIAPEQSTAHALLSDDKAEQDAFLDATAWRFATHQGLNQLSSTPRTVMLAEDELSLGAQEDIYITGETALAAVNDLTVDAGRRIGLLGAINTNFRLNMGNGTRETGYFEEQVTVSRQPVYTNCGKDCSNVIYADVPVTENVWVSTGFEAYDDLAYDSFVEIGETLQLGTLMRDVYLAEVPTLNNETGETDRLAYARQTGLYDLTSTSLTAGGDLSLNSGGDILNFGGSLVSGENLYLTAETDIRNEALRHNFTLTPEHGCVAYGCGRQGHEYKAAEILAGSGMVLTAGGDIVNNGAVITAAGSILAQAEGDIINSALTSQYLYHYISSSSLFGLKRKKELLHRAVISEGVISTEYGDVILNAGRDVLSEGAMISAGADVQITADRDVRLTAKSEELHNYYKKRGFSGLSYGENRIRWNEFSTAFSQIEGNNIAISAGRDVTGMGALLFAAQDIDVTAGEDITFDAHQNLRYVSRSGWSIGISFGGSGIIEALLNDGDVLEAYVSTNPSLAAVHRLATGDFSAGSLVNLAYHLPSLGSAINNGATGPTSITESLYDQLNPFSWTQENALFDPDAFNADSPANGFLNGITFRLGAYRSRQEWTESHVSQLIAGQDLWIDAGQDIALVGGTVASGNRDVSLYAGENILVAALADTSRSSSSGWGLSLGFGASGVTFGADFNRSQANSRMYTNAALTAGETLDIVSGQDTVLMGANLAAPDIYLDVGNDLIVQSRQNTSDSNSFGFNFSISTSGAFSGGISLADANRNYTETPTTIVAQERLSIYTGATTYLLGAGLWSETGNLDLDTAVLVFDNYDDSATSTSGGLNVSLNFQETLASARDASGSLAYSNTQAITYATIGAGNITVREAHADFTVDALNRDPDNMQQVLSSTNFSIEIPGINLVRWTEQVEDTVNLIEAIRTNVPDHVRAEGAQAVDQYRDLILRGATGLEAARLVSTPEFRQALNLRRRYVEAIENPDGLGPNPSALLAAIGQGEQAFWDASQGKYVIETDCGAGFGPTPCQVLVSAGELSATYTAADVTNFYMTAFETLRDAVHSEDAGILEFARLAAACLAQVAIETNDPAVIQNARSQIGEREFAENLVRAGVDPRRFDLTERLLIASNAKNAVGAVAIRNEINELLSEVTARYGHATAAGYGRLWQVANFVATELEAGREIGPDSQILDTSGGGRMSMARGFKVSMSSLLTQVILRSLHYCQVTSLIRPLEGQ